MKSVLISIQPKWCELIASGKKTVEVRKTVPKLEPPFKCYIYCTKDEKYCLDDGKSRLNGKVIGEFVCDIVEPYWFMPGDTDIEQYEDVQLSCLSAKEILDYGNGKQLYFWNISDLVIYDEPKPLSYFNHCGVNYHFNPPITRPPQSWCYVEEVKEGG